MHRESGNMIWMGCIVAALLIGGVLGATVSHRPEVIDVEIMHLNGKDWLYRCWSDGLVEWYTPNGWRPIGE